MEIFSNLNGHFQIFYIVQLFFCTINYDRSVFRIYLALHSTVPIAKSDMAHGDSAVVFFWQGIMMIMMMNAWLSDMLGLLLPIAGPSASRPPPLAEAVGTADCQHDSRDDDHVEELWQFRGIYSATKQLSVCRYLLGNTHRNRWTSEQRVEVGRMYVNHFMRKCQKIKKPN